MTLNHTNQKGQAQLCKTLTLFQIIMIGLAYIQPMTLFDTFGIATEKTNGNVPTAYFVALAGMLLTAFSYGKLVKRYPSAGSAYTYAQKAISPHVGFMVGWSSLLDYMLMPMINILLANIYLTNLYPSIPGWVFVTLMVTAVTLINLIGIRLVANLNGVVVIVQLALILYFLILIINGVYHGEGQGTLLSTRPIFSSDSSVVGIISGASVLCFSFLGFDGLSSLSEEAADAKSIVPKSMVMTALIGGLIFIVVTYFLQLYLPNVSRLAKPDESLPEIALIVGGATFQHIMLLITCVTVLASGLAAQTGVSRLLYVMGRDGVFPRKIFGYIHPKTQTPVINILLVGFLSLTAMFFNLDIALALVNFGALVAFTFVNLSVIAQYFIKEQRNKTASDIFSYLIMPILGVVVIGALWFNLDEYSMILGIVWGGIGLMYLFVLTKGFRKLPPQYVDKVVTISGKIEHQ